jgi:hypothetical protein
MTSVTTKLNQYQYQVIEALRSASFGDVDDAGMIKAALSDWMNLHPTPLLVEGLPSGSDHKRAAT